MSPTRTTIHAQRSWLVPVHRFCDAAAISIGIPLAAWSKPHELDHRLVALAAVAIVLHFLIAEVTGLYRSWRGTATDQEILSALGTWLLVLIALIALASADNYFDLPVSEAIRWGATTALIMAVGRITLRLILRVLRMRGINTRRFAIVGVNELAFQLARNIQHAPELGMHLSGFYDDRQTSRLPQIPDDVGVNLGDIDQLVEECRRGETQIVYITFPMRAEERIKKVLEQLSDSTASVYVVPDFFVFQLLHSRWTQIGGLPAVSVFENPFYGVDGLVKRAVDFALASCILLAVSIPMLLIAIGIKLTSPGPVFFRQKRYGLGGQQINVWKFRSMTVCENTDVAQATRNDPRVTRLGAFLRRTSLDELPQLFNVIGGSMSLVGPRPHANQHNEGYRKLIHGYMLRHKVKPGITGLAQVNGWRGETDTLEKMQKRIEFDHQYIREWSPWLDVKILFKTIFTVLSKQNAY